jgi:hypothetical protein
MSLLSGSNLEFIKWIALDTTVDEATQTLESKEGMISNDTDELN